MVGPQGSASSIHRPLFGPNMEEKPDLKFRHVVWPAVFAIALVAGSVLVLDENKFPPMMIALVAAVPFAPLLSKLTNSGDSKNMPLESQWFASQWLVFGHLDQIIST